MNGVYKMNGKMVSLNSSGRRFINELKIEQHYTEEESGCVAESSCYPWQRDCTLSATPPSLAMLLVQGYCIFCIYLSSPIAPFPCTADLYSAHLSRPLPPFYSTPTCTTLILPALLPLSSEHCLVLR